MNTLKQLFIPAIALGALSFTACFNSTHTPISVEAAAGPEQPTTQSGEYRVLEPIESGAVTLYPIVRVDSDTRAAKWQYITLDEGLKSGEVVITEAGKAAGLARNRHNRDGVSEREYSSDSVNTLVLLNNSAHPLVLLAGEIVTGGKQDRIIAKDRIVAPHGAPLDLGVFCIEPHRWTELSSNFGSSEKVAKHSMIVEPSVRREAMATQSQQEVWNAVNKSVDSSRSSAGASHSTYAYDANEGGGSPASTSSYARAMAAPAQQQQIDKVASPALVNDSAMPDQLRKQNVVGVVAAINGHILWADVFASHDLLEAYWSKLVRSYAAESLHDSTNIGPTANRDEALKFVEAEVKGTETSEGSSGVYRYFEVQGHRDSEFTLQVTLPNTGFNVHRARMVHEKNGKTEKQPIVDSEPPTGYHPHPRPGVIY